VEIQEKKAHAATSALSGELLQLVTFAIEEEEFAVDILNIQGINRMVEVTRVPNAPSFVEGIINLRGQVIPIIDLRKRLLMPPREYDKQTRFIVVEFSNRVIGFIVDSVHEVLRINKDLTEPPPAMVSGVESDYITAVAKLEDRLIILLDLEKILSLEQHEELSNLTV
jgi:purine-binding chemotaxis protein CheW